MKRSPVFLVVILYLLAAVPMARAQGADIIITSASVTADQQTLVVRGSQFGSVAPGVVL